MLILSERSTRSNSIPQTLSGERLWVEGEYVVEEKEEGVEERGDWKRSWRRGIRHQRGEAKRNELQDGGCEFAGDEEGVVVEEEEKEEKEKEEKLGRKI